MAGNRTKGKDGLEALVTVKHNLAAGMESECGLLLCPLWLPMVL